MGKRKHIHVDEEDYQVDPELRKLSENLRPLLEGLKVKKEQLADFAFHIHHFIEEIVDHANAAEIEKDELKELGKRIKAVLLNLDSVSDTLENNITGN